MLLTPAAVLEFERCIGRGGVAVFPADTVYGLACNPGSPRALERMYALKKRAPDRPAAVMFFTLERALTALPELGPRTISALRALLPGALTVVVANPRGRYPLASSGHGLGVRVPLLQGQLAPLAGARVAVLQTSANPSGGADARMLGDVAPEILAGADTVLDGGELSGAPSTVVDLTGFERDGRWEVLRESAVPRHEVARLLDSCG